MERSYLDRSGMVKDKWDWDCSNNFSFKGDRSSDFSWPPKNYTCSFCKRQFSSAQGLGGHMNVHRRDRARLRQLHSWVFECPNPNPNFSESSSKSSSPSAMLPPKTYTHHSSVSPSLIHFSPPSYKGKSPIILCPRHDPSTLQSEEQTKKKSLNSVLGVGELMGCSQKYELEVLKEKKGISLDLEMGFKDPKETLDLELRLGY